MDLDFDTSTTQIRQKLLEIYQVEDKISFSHKAEFGKFQGDQFGKKTDR